MQYLRILITYRGGPIEEIICDTDVYQTNDRLFKKHYKKFLKALNVDHEGAGLIDASKYFECENVFVSTKNIVSIRTDLYSFSDDLMATPTDDPTDPFNALHDLADSTAKLVDEVKAISTTLKGSKSLSTNKKKTEKKILLEKVKKSK